MRDVTTVVVGAGYVGQRVITALRDRPTLALGRSTSLDLDTDKPLPVTLPPACRLLYTVPPSPDQATDVRLARLLKLLVTVPLHITYISTTGVYGDCAGRVVDEDSPVQPATERASRRVSAESILQAWAAAHDRPWHILRVPGIYGPGRLGIDRIRNAVPIIQESEAYPGNRVHVDDLVHCCIRSLTGDAPSGIYNVGDGDHRSPTWFAHEVARQAGLAPRPETRRELRSESRRVSTQRMRDVLGVIPKYANAGDGIRASLDQG